MTTRGRSKTADPGDLRKVARAHHAPRKFTEKIAMMKQREAQHAAAFAEVMSNMAQHKTVGYAEDLGGSMPTLNHDFINGSVKSIDLQLAFRDLSKVKSNASKARPRHLRRNWSSGSKTTADIDPYPMNLTHLNDSWLNRQTPSMKNNQWSYGGSLSNSSMHKSDSDLHQSLLQEQQAANLLPPYMGTQSLEYQQPIPVSNYMPTSVSMGYQPMKYNVGQSQRRGKLSDTMIPSSTLNVEQHAMARKRPSSTSSALASIEQYMPLSSENSNTLQPLSNVQSKISSSLPDLTNTNFYCGLDRPIDEDKPLENDGYLSSLGQKTQNQFYGQPQQKGFILSCLSNISTPMPNSTWPGYNNIHCSTQSSSTINSLNVMSSLPDGTNSNFGQASTSASGAPNSQPFTNTTPLFGNPDSKDLCSSSTPSGFLSSALGKQPQPSTDPMTLLLPSATSGTLSNRYAGTLFEIKKPTPPPSYTEHIFQTAVLQHKMASISMCNNDGEGLTRSHSDENLPAQKGGNLQQNPFMGNMMSASSVPSIYVEPNEQALFDYLPIRNSPADSPSESTTASYASSPPHMRAGFDQSMSFHDAYYDWPLGESDKLTERSSLSHHKSLTELSMIAEEPHLQKPSLSHQLSLPSINIDNGKPMDQDMPGLNSFPMDDNELGFVADFSVLDNTQLPDLTTY